MSTGKPVILSDRVDREFLPLVRRPSRYIGGEINQIKKDLAAVDLTFALCFPDTYEVGSSYSGLAILYDVLNKLPNVAAERVFTPWIDAEQILRRKNIPLFSLESKAAVSSFDVIGFSLTSELCYTNLLNMLDLSGLKLRSAQRSDSDPLVIAGGLMANCCEPLAPFIDLFVLGEAENAIVELAAFLIEHKKKGAAKSDILLAAAKRFDWIYVPSLYRFEYDGEKILSFHPSSPDLRTEFDNAVVDDFDNAPVPAKPIVPFPQAVHERIAIEIMRGCPGRCRFCQASFCRRPIRYRSPKRVLQIAQAAWLSTGLDTIGLLSLSTADYPDLEELIQLLHGFFSSKYVGLSLPSLRVDKHLQIIPQLVSDVRKSGITIAVEAASEKLRLVINKPLQDTDLFAAVEAAYRAGWQKIKLYFIVGLPGETDNDVLQIVHLASRLARLRTGVSGRPAQISVAVAWLVPKPHTPLGFLGQKPEEYFQNAKQLILAEKRKLNAKYLQFKFHDIDQSVLESAIARGDRRLADVIEAAFRNGARFDLWNESFKPALWEDAFQKAGLSLAAAAQKNFTPAEILPWQHLSSPDKYYLLKHLSEALALAKPA